MDFPSNSKVDPSTKKKTPKADRPVVESVIQEGVSEKRPGLKERFKHLFLGSDFKGASRYIVSDVMLPAVRNMVVDGVTKGVERFVYGESTSTRRGASPRGRTIYNTQVDRSRSRMAVLPDQPPRRLPEQGANTNHVVLNTREDADAVLEALRDIIDKYEVASVADFRSLVGLPSTYVDNNWGWDNLTYVQARQVREGYLLDLPHAEPIT